MVNYCCDDMKNNLYDIIQNKIFDNGDKEDKIVYYFSRFNEYGIPIKDGNLRIETSYIEINYCPWCGKKLPISKRDEWFDILEKMGYESPFEDNIPEKYKTSEWYST